MNHRIGKSVLVGTLLGIIACSLVVIVDRLVHRNEYEGKWMPMDRHIVVKHREWKT